MSRCAACGLPGHRYGRNEGMERFDPMACINQLRGELERLVDFPSDGDVEAAAEAMAGPHEWERPGGLRQTWTELARVALEAVAEARTDPSAREKEA